MTITELLRRGSYSTDKQGPGTTQHRTGHCYGNFYDREFARFKHQPIDLLEIGIYSGGSLRLWYDFFTRANITGIDNDFCLIEKDLFKLDRIRMIESDAYDPNFVSSLGMFDFIIDDGPHQLGYQLKSIELYLPHLKPGGTLIIEDVQSDAFIEPLKRAVPNHMEKEVYDLREFGKYDDILFVVRNMKYPLFT